MLKSSIIILLHRNTNYLLSPIPKYQILFCVVLLFSSVISAQNINQIDSLGRKQGKWEKKYPNGQIAYRGTFKDDKIVGTFWRYYDNGKRMAKMSYTTAGDSAFVEMYSIVGTLQASGVMVNQKKTGLWKGYEKDGQIIMTMYYKNGSLDSVMKVYDKYPQVIEVKHFVKGVQTGLYNKFDDNGRLAVEMLYLQGRPHGRARFYYTNGRVRVEGVYYQGFRKGDWTFYNPDGTLLKTLHYVNGVPEKQEELDEELSKVLDSLLQNKDYFQEPEMAM